MDSMIWGDRMSNRFFILALCLAIATGQESTGQESTGQESTGQEALPRRTKTKAPSRMIQRSFKRSLVHFRGLFESRRAPRPRQS